MAGHLPARVVEPRLAGSPHVRESYFPNSKRIRRIPKPPDQAATRFALRVEGLPNPFRLRPPVPTTNCTMPVRGRKPPLGSCGAHRWFVVVTHEDHVGSRPVAGARTPPTGQVEALGPARVLVLQPVEAGVMEAGERAGGFAVRMGGEIRLQPVVLRVARSPGRAGNEAETFRTGRLCGCSGAGPCRRCPPRPRSARRNRRSLLCPNRRRGLGRRPERRSGPRAPQRG